MNIYTKKRVSKGKQNTSDFIIFLRKLMKKASSFAGKNFFVYSYFTFLNQNRGGALKKIDLKLQFID